MRSRSRIVALGIAIAAAAGPASASAATLFADDVEAGVGAWTATGLWHRVAAGDACASAHQGTASWYYGSAAAGCTYDTPGAANAGTLTSAPFALPAVGSAVLEFWTSYQTEDSGTAWDRRIVQVSVDGGAFTNVRQVAGPPTIAWELVTIDLSAYAGHTLRLRFSFDTGDDVLNAFRGWYVDDIQVFTFGAQFVTAPATYGWIDIAAPANDTGIACDDCQATHPIGFPFRFYGATYTAVNISSNGYVTFAGGATAYSNVDIPRAAAPNAYAAPFWDDLYVTGAARVYAATVGAAPDRKLVVTWSRVDYCCAVGSGPLTFQLVLSEADAGIVFQYADIAATQDPDRGLGGSATVGLENQAGTSGLRHSYDLPVLSDGLALRYLDDADGDGVSDLDEGIIGTDPLVPDLPPLLVLLSGPGTTHGTAYLRLGVTGDVSQATALRVFYGPWPGTTASDYPMHADLPPTALAGVIDQQWGMQGVPLVYFRVAAVKSVSGRDFIGLLSNEHAAYFAGEGPKDRAATAGAATTTTTRGSAGCSSGGAGLLGLLLAAAGALRRRPGRQGAPPVR